MDCPSNLCQRSQGEQLVAIVEGDSFHRGFSSVTDVVLRIVESVWGAHGEGDDGNGSTDGVDLSCCLRQAIAFS
eukprot:5815883-Karenia_brevis.AAC.1